ncbi:aldo/keto reductase [Streptomyces sp. 21So2-11]|uniref:aldo/keto reductase n=1 Tax=Streptomyces sp. 21So2-11 TaxID=3144408 RepID=UPI00321B4F09
MNARFGLGTYRCQDTASAASVAVASGVDWIDTAPNYHHGLDEIALAPVLKRHRHVGLSIKVGFIAPSTWAEAVAEGVLPAEEAGMRHSLQPGFIRWQLVRSVQHLGRTPDVVFVHNPEHPGAGQSSLADLSTRLLDAFDALESACADGLARSYGLATWSGFSDGHFTVRQLLAIARRVGGGNHRFRAVQMPLSLVHVAPLHAALNGQGVLVQAGEAGLEVFASAPLHGGALAELLTPEAIALIGRNLSPAQAALAVVASTPGVNRVLLSASSPRHWNDAVILQDRAPVPPDQLRKALDVLAAG